MEALALPSWEFLALAYRASAYQGMMRARVEQAEAGERRNVRPGARLVEADRRSVMADPLLADVIDFG